MDIQMSEMDEGEAIHNIRCDSALVGFLSLR